MAVLCRVPLAGVGSQDRDHVEVNLLSGQLGNNHRNGLDDSLLALDTTLNAATGGITPVVFVSYLESMVSLIELNSKISQ